MHTVSSPVEEFNAQEPIPGYRLKTRIGSGGFGEVWEAEAPGGLAKAVKVVFGSANDSRAKREWKALERIKQVHHPMLLSLERFEVVGDHLVIVTELAESSLRDVFDKHRETGSPGIPRDALLDYMKDAAEALDYLFTTHNLQHLDVKPENLLLLANRVKVADFGLVKEVQDQSQSMVGGLTPSYAPPELFDGRPDPHSDQYSLAIVYQEMLTGAPPFAGRTAAQLAAQHLRGKPSLSQLPPADQTVIGRALSKDPNRRFPNCQAMVEALRAAVSSSSSRSTRRRAENASRPARQYSSSNTTTRAIDFPVAVENQALPAIECEQATELQPAVFIGVGSLAGKTLQNLRRKLVKLSRDDSLPPAWRMLLIDTDSSALDAASRGDLDALQQHELVATPLRETSYYRSQSSSLLEWLGRRWLYNIPRSLQTEGLRPLGRLALVDHFSHINQKLMQAFADINSATTLQESQQQLDQPFADRPPRIFLIGATSGGTAGGMLIDLAYACRSLLVEQGISDEFIHGLLVHGVPSVGGQRELAIANTLAVLHELDYFTSGHGAYPGEPACGIPEYPANVGPFNHTYFVAAEDELSQTTFESTAETLADYLYQNIATPAGNVLDIARETDPLSAGTMTLRTFGLTRLESDDQNDTDREALLCARFVENWLQPGEAAPSTPKTFGKTQLEALAKQFLQGLGLTLDDLRKCVEPHMLAAMSGDIRSFLCCEISKIQELNRSADSAEIARLLKQRIRSDDRDGIGSALKTNAGAKVAEEASKRTDALIDWLGMLVDSPGIRVGGARLTLTFVSQYLSELGRRIGAKREALLEDAENLLKRAPAGNLALQHGLTLVEAESFSLLEDLLKAIRNAVFEFEENLDSLSSKLLRLQRHFGADASRSLASQPLRGPLQAVDSELFKRPFSLCHLHHGGQNAWADLERKIRHAIQPLASQSTGPRKPSVSRERLNRAYVESIPNLLECGGSTRLFAISPYDQQASVDLVDLLHESCGHEPTLVPVTDGELHLCVEAGAIPWENVLIAISHGQEQFFDFASRLRTRRDIAWPDFQAPSEG